MLIPPERQRGGLLVGDGEPAILHTTHLSLLPCCISSGRRRHRRAVRCSWCSRAQTRRRRQVAPLLLQHPLLAARPLKKPGRDPQKAVRLGLAVAPPRGRAPSAALASLRVPPPTRPSRAWPQLSSASAFGGDGHPRGRSMAAHSASRCGARGCRLWWCLFVPSSTHLLGAVVSARMSSWSWLRRPRGSRAKTPCGQRAPHRVHFHLRSRAEWSCRNGFRRRGAR